jgi:hypothetical protein
MGTFMVTVTETNQKKIAIEANSADEAIDIVEEQYKKDGIALDLKRIKISTEPYIEEIKEYNIGWAIMVSNEETIKEYLEQQPLKNDPCADAQHIQTLLDQIDSGIIAFEGKWREVLQTYGIEDSTCQGHIDNALTGNCRVPEKLLKGLIENCNDRYSEQKKIVYHASVGHSNELVKLSGCLHPAVSFDVEFFDIPEELFD